VLVLHAALWLAMPVYWHLHWCFPEPLRPLPRWVWAIVYAPGVVLALAEWFVLPRSNLYQFGLLLALLGSVVLSPHAFLRLADRRDRHAAGDRDRRGPAGHPVGLRAVFVPPTLNGLPLAPGAAPATTTWPIAAAS
jgi:hypothetical protein